jgi:hypothetical protein
MASGEGAMVMVLVVSDGQCDRAGYIYEIGRIELQAQIRSEYDKRVEVEGDGDGRYL